MTEQQVRELIARATDRNGLAAAYEAMSAWYNANPSDRTTYDFMYDAYLAKYYAVVAAEGGGPPVVAKPTPLGEPVPFGQGEQLGGFPTFIRALPGAGAPQYGPGAAWAREQYGPMMEAFYGQQAARGQPTIRGGEFPTTDWTQFVPSALAGGIGGLTSRMGRMAGQSLQDILSAVGTRDISPLVAGQEMYGLPETEQQFGYGANLARLAARGRMGGIAASRLVPTAGELYERFLGRPEGQDLSQWLPFLQQYLGL